MKTWETVARRRVLEMGKFLAVESHTVQLPDGRVLPDWPWVITPDYVNVVAVTDQSSFLCFRQTKYAVHGISLAPIGGYLEPGEEPLSAAQRELLEETGYLAQEWIPLGAFRVDGNRGAGTANFFLACGIYQAASPHSDDLEAQEMVWLSRAEMESALANGEFKLLPWQAVVALGLLYLNRMSKRKEGKMPEIKRFPKTRVASVKETGPFTQAIPRGFAKLFSWLTANKLQPVGQSLGIFPDDPAKVPADKLRSELCAPVAENVQGSGEIEVKELPSFEAATIIYQGDANISSAYDQVYGWLHAQGYRDVGAVIERYLSVPGEELRAEIFVPIVKAEPRPDKTAGPEKKKPVRKAAKKTWGS